MRGTAVVHVHPSGALVALLGNPNSGKTALFNRLTGSRQKVANYAGVTVERKEGRTETPGGRRVRVLDLPGTYGLHPRSPDERVTVDVLHGRAVGEKRPDLVVCVVDASNLRRHLKLVLAAQRLGLPCLLVLNMADQAERRGLPIDAEAWSRRLRMPVVRTVAVTGEGLDALRARLDDPATWQPPAEPLSPGPEHDSAVLQQLLAEAEPGHDAHHGGAEWSDRIDHWVLHPVAGPLLLAVLLFVMFQAVFAWAEPPKAWIEAGAAALGGWVTQVLPEGVLRSLLVDGLIAGVGGVLVFLPQIVILFAFILTLEDSGYLPRAAYLLDRVMGSLGLSGRSFIPLLSSFACAVPGIMATRTIANPRDRLVTMALAPLMTCSARLPVYALLIGAFVPPRTVAGGIGLQGLVLFALYVAGVAGAAALAWVLKLATARRQVRTLMLELPSYHWPDARNVGLGLWQKVWIFLRRVGGIILVMTLVIWLLASFPAPPPGATGNAVIYSFAGQIGRALEPLFAPIGFNWQICVALVPGMAAREVAVSALATVYAIDGGREAAAQLAPVIAGGWSVATGFALLAWYVFAPQCLSTIAALRRESGGWALPAAVTALLFALAYVAAGLTFHIARALGSG